MAAQEILIVAMASNTYGCVKLELQFLFHDPRAQEAELAGSKKGKGAESDGK